MTISPPKALDGVSLKKEKKIVEPGSTPVGKNQKDSFPQPSSGEHDSPKILAKMGQKGAATGPAMREKEAAVSATVDLSTAPQSSSTPEARQVQEIYDRAYAEA